VIPTDMEHKPHHYLVIAPRDDTPANISFWEASEDSNYSESREKSVRPEVRGLHFKSAVKEKRDEQMKFLGLSKLLKTITVKLTDSLLPLLLLYGIDRKCNQIHSSYLPTRAQVTYWQSLNFNSWSYFLGQDPRETPKFLLIRIKSDEVLLREQKWRKVYICVAAKVLNERLQAPHPL
jgi:hypothetical protein